MVIDLDAYSSAAETSGRGPRPASRAAARPLAVAAVVLVVLALGGSAAPLPGLRRALAVENTSGAYALTPTALFTADFGRAPGREALVRRHPLDDRSARWSTQVPQTVGTLDVVEPAQVLAVGPPRVLMATSVDSLRTTFLDSRTGAILWSTTTGSVLRLADTGALMTGGTADSAVLRRVDLRTGRTLWLRELGSTGHIDAGDPAAGPSGRVVTVDRRGRAAVLAVADGSVLATAELGAAPGRAEDDGRGDAAVYTAVGDRLYLARRVGGEASLTAYRLPDLRRLWRTGTAPLERPTWCGPDLLCVTTAAGLTVLDNDTGTVRWSDDRWRSGLDSRALGIPGPPRIAAVDDRPDSELALLDPATGSLRSVLGAGTVVGTTLLRPDRTDRGRTWVQTTGPHDAVRTLGTVDTAAPGRCAATADHLACPASSGRLTVWRLPAEG